MCKLISAAFFRLKKSNIFYGFLLIMGSVGIFRAYTLKIGTLDIRLMDCAPWLILISGVFISLFIGTEYSDGTIRNKLVVGHSRLAVYFASLVVCSVAIVLIILAYTVPYTIAGLIRGYVLESKLSVICFYLICEMLMGIAEVSLMLMVVLLVINKAYSAVACLILGIAMIFGSAYIYQMLEEPKTIESYIYINEFGVPTEVEEALNPNYVDGTVREIMDFIDEALPSSQSIILNNAFSDIEIGKDSRFPIPIHFPAYSMAFTVVFMGLGIVLFRKKDIK